MLGRKDRLDGAHVVVTGASAGVGRATVLAYVRRGARVTAVARNAEALETVRRTAPWQVRVALGDVADAARMEDIAAEAVLEQGPVDVWVNNAMASVFAPFTAIAARDFERVTATTYLGQVNGTRSALAQMLPRDRGTIVQVGSALAYRGIPLQSAYCGAKHAVKGFTEAVRTELRHQGSAVRVVMVQLPGLNTTQFDLVRTRLPRRPRPVAPVYQPEVAAEAIVWASLHPRRREVYVGSATLATIAGSFLAPGFLDRYLARTAFDGQQTDEPVSEERVRTDYLYSPVPGDYGVHGAFDGEAHAHGVRVSR